MRNNDAINLKYLMFMEFEEGFLIKDALKVEYLVKYTTCLKIIYLLDSREYIKMRNGDATSSPQVPALYIY